MAHPKFAIWVVVASAAVAVGSYPVVASIIGQEVAVPVHLQDGQELLLLAGWKNIANEETTGLSYGHAVSYLTPRT